MAEETNTQILIIGGPNVGKTHFGGQLYGRLQTRSGLFKIVSPPENLTVFKEVLEKLNDGKSAGHTIVSANDVLELELENHSGQKTLLSFPDYGGEQVNSIVTDRRINKTWADQLEKSNSWMLFIRPDLIPVIEDIVNRGIPDQEALENRNKEVEPLILSKAAFFTELLQMLLYAKQTLNNTGKLPRLVIALSCWDLVAERFTNKLPNDALGEILPAFSSFVKNTWGKNHAVIALSSTEKTLSLEDPDSEYVRKGPESFGYLITENGKVEKDLTSSIEILIGK